MIADNLDKIRGYFHRRAMRRVLRRVIPEALHMSNWEQAQLLYRDEIKQLLKDNLEIAAGKLWLCRTSEIDKDGTNWLSGEQISSVFEEMIEELVGSWE